MKSFTKGTPTDICRIALVLEQTEAEDGSVNQFVSKEKLFVIYIDCDFMNFAWFLLYRFLKKAMFILDEMLETVKSLL